MLCISFGQASASIFEHKEGAVLSLVEDTTPSLASVLERCPPFQDLISATCPRKGDPLHNTSVGPSQKYLIYENVPPKAPSCCNGKPYEPQPQNTADGVSQVLARYLAGSEQRLRIAVVGDSTVMENFRYMWRSLSFSASRYGSPLKISGEESLGMIKEGKLGCVEWEETVAKPYFKNALKDSSLSFKAAVGLLRQLNGQSDGFGFEIFEPASNKTISMQFHRFNAVPGVNGAGMGGMCDTPKRCQPSEVASCIQSAFKIISDASDIVIANLGIHYNKDAIVAPRGGEFVHRDKGGERYQHHLNALAIILLELRKPVFFLEAVPQHFINNNTYLFDKYTLDTQIIDGFQCAMEAVVPNATTLFKTNWPAGILAGEEKLDTHITLCTGMSDPESLNQEEANWRNNFLRQIATKMRIPIAKIWGKLAPYCQFHGDNDWDCTHNSRGNPPDDWGLIVWYAIVDILVHAPALPDDLSGSKGATTPLDSNCSQDVSVLECILGSDTKAPPTLFPLRPFNVPFEKAHLRVQHWKS